MSTDSSNSTSSSNSTVTMASTPVPTNGLTRSRRSHFSRKESTPEGNREQQLNASARIVHEYERLIFYAKSPHSWVLPRDWAKIIEKHPTIARNKVNSEHDNNNNNYSNYDNTNNSNNNINNFNRRGFYARSVSHNSTFNNSICG